MKNVCVGLFVLFFNIQFANAQRNDSTRQFLINIDISNVLIRNTSGLGFQYEKKSLQLRSSFFL